MMQYYRKTSHTTFDCTYHIVWITKYRYPVMVGDIATRARDLVREICKENQVEIVRGTVARDHIHIYISIPPYLSVSKLVQYLKGKTSRKIQQEFPELSSRELTFHVFSNLRGFSPEWFNEVLFCAVCLTKQRNMIRCSKPITNAAFCGKVVDIS